MTELSCIAHPSPNHNERRGGAHVETLVLHYTGMQSGAAALDRLCDPAAEVSAHYLIEEDGRIFQLVPEARRAWHAGAGFWRGERDLNSRSIGIEIVNPGHEFGYRPFPEAQMKSVVDLCRDIVARHRIAPIQVIGHSDLAPSRKTDPGELFDWPRLAAGGVGLWPETILENGDPDQLVADLEQIGYDITDPGDAITAFQRHWCPDQLGQGGDPVTAATARCILQMLDT